MSADRIMKNFLFIIIVFVILLTFWPVVNNNFVNWDDDIYIINNGMIKDLSWPSIKEIFTSFHYGSYKPLTFLTFAVEYHFVRLSPFLFHLNNLLLHIANFFIVFWLIFLLFEDKTLSFLTSILFAIHPLRVESVAWVTERKDLLYAFFFLCSIVLYIKYRKNGFFLCYLFSFFCFLFSLLAKPQGIILPIGLLLVDYILDKKINRTYPRINRREGGAFVRAEARSEDDGVVAGALRRGRTTQPQAEQMTSLPTRDSRIGSKHLLEGKLPFIIMAFLFSIINIYAQSMFISARKAASVLSFKNILSIPYIIEFYVKKTFIPDKLSNIYPSFEASPISFVIIISVIIFLSAVIFLSKKYTNKLIFGSLFFIFPLLPVMQIIPSGPSQVADRYMYLPSIGLFFIFSTGWLWIFRKKQPYRVILLILIVFLFSSLCFLTNERTKIWKNSFTLWNDVISKFPNLSIAYNNRGAAYMETGNFDKALSDLNKTIEINPRTATGYHDRGFLYALIGDFDKAIADYSMAIRFDSSFTDAYNDRGISLAFKGSGREAVNDLTQAIKLSPKNYNLFNNRGSIYLSEGLKELAIKDFSAAIEIEPKNIAAYKNRAMAYFDLKEYESSWQDIQIVQRLGGEMTDDFIKQLKMQLISKGELS